MKQIYLTFIAAISDLAYVLRSFSAKPQEIFQIEFPRKNIVQAGIRCEKGVTF